MATAEQATNTALQAAGQPRNPLFLVLLVLALLNTGATGWLVYTQHMGMAHREATAAAIDDPPTAESAATLPEETALAALEPFIANLADPGGKRYLRTTFEMEVSPPSAVDEAQKKTAQIRDTILLVLTSRSYDDIRTTAGKAALREEIVAELNKILSRGKVRQLFFKEFIVQ